MRLDPPADHPEEQMNAERMLVCAIGWLIFVISFICLLVVFL